MKRAWWIFFVLLTALAVFSVKRKSAGPRPGEAVTDGPANTPPRLREVAAPEKPEPLTPSIPETNVASADSFSKALTACFGAGAREASPAALLERLRAGGVRVRDVPLENWHIRRPDGREERVMRVTSDRDNGGDVKELRLFGVDAEGLPVPKPLDPRRALNPTEADVRSLIGDGDLVFHGWQETLTFADGTTAALDWTDGGLRDAQVFLKGRTLSCRKRACVCE